MIIWTTHICKCVCGYAQIERCYLLSECRMCVIRNDICSTLARCKIQLIRSLLWCVIAFASYFQRYTHSSMWLWHARKQYIWNSLSAIRYSPSLLLSPLSSLYCIFIVCYFSRYKDITYSKCGCVLPNCRNQKHYFMGLYDIHSTHTQHTALSTFTHLRFVCIFAYRVQTKTVQEFFDNSSWAVCAVRARLCWLIVPCIYDYLW